MEVPGEIDKSTIITINWSRKQKSKKCRSEQLIDKLDVST